MEKARYLQKLNQNGNLSLSYRDKHFFFFNVRRNHYPTSTSQSQLLYIWNKTTKKDLQSTKTKLEILTISSTQTSNEQNLLLWFDISNKEKLLENVQSKLAAMEEEFA